MAIQNIQTLANKNGLTYLGTEYMQQYYNEALANLGQRNTNDTLLEYVSFTPNDVITEELSYFLILNKLENNNIKYYTINKTIEEEEIIDLLYKNLDLNDENYFKELELLTDFNDDNNSVILQNKFNIINELCNIVDSNLLFIPINYLFKYVCNGINKVIFYNNAKDIYVNYLPTEYNENNNEYKIDTFDFINNIFCFYNNNNNNKFIKTTVYDFVYNPNIEYSVKFTLPYIDNDNKWVINDKPTDIQAKANDGINLNIILACAYYTADGLKYKYLSGLSNIDENKINYLKKPIYIKINNEIKECTFEVPKISDNTILNNYNNADTELLNRVLRNSTLIVMTKISDIISDINDLSNGYVTTLWTYNESTNTYDYLYIESDNGRNIALDFNVITNFENLLKQEIKNVKLIEPDNYLFTYLIFDQIYQSTKQESNNNYTYGVIQNIKGNYYNNKYANNMNFSLKYIDHISGTVGNSIDKISHSGVKYLNINKNNNYVTNSLYKYVINNKINYYNEYIPNYNVPLFDMSEFLVKDINTMNKYNILSFDYNGNIFYSYLGTSYTNDKNILRIGTSNTNINLGEETLVNSSDKNNLLKQDVFSIDFNNTYINGNVNIKSDITVDGKLKLNKSEWIINKFNDIEIMTTTIVPQFKYYNYKGNNYIKLNIENLSSQVANIQDNIEQENSEYKYGQNKDYLYLNIILYIEHDSENNLPYYYKYNDLLILQNLVPYLGLTSNDVTTFDSTTNEIIYVNNMAKYLVSSNNYLSDVINITSSTNSGISIDIVGLNKFYIGNMLYITYIPSEKKLIVNEMQSNKIKSVWKIPTNN